jgi:hypothetical protein
MAVKKLEGLKGKGPAFMGWGGSDGVIDSLMVQEW